jgi:hypothetical protein
VAVDFHGWTEKLHREVSREKEDFLRQQDAIASSDGSHAGVNCYAAFLAEGSMWTWLQAHSTGLP